MPDTLSTKSLREERLSIATQMRGLVEAAGKENRGLNDDEKAQFDAMDEKQAALLERVEQIDKMEQLEKHLGEKEDRIEHSEHRPNPKTGDDRPSYDDQQRAFRTWALSKDPSGAKLTEKDMDNARRCGFDLNPGQTVEIEVPLMRKAPRSIAQVEEWARQQELTYRATTAQTITTTGGGDVIQNEMMREIEVALLAFGGMREVAQVIRTDTGATLPYPTVNDTTEVSTVVAINTAADVKSLGFGQVTLAAFKYSTGIILVPMELMQDSAIDLVGLIGRALGERAAKGTNADFTTGATDAVQPAGIVVESLVGTTGSDVNTVTYNELTDLEHSIDPAYRRDPSARFMFHDTTFKVVKQLVDSDGRPLWLPGLSGIGGSFPDRLLDYQYVINQDMASIAGATTGPGGAKAILFGAMNRYKIRDVRAMQVLRLNERYAELAQTAFLAFHRHDGKSVFASTVTVPFKHFITKST